jgi:hypothetical protein
MSKFIVVYDQKGFLGITHEVGYEILESTNLAMALVSAKLELRIINTSSILPKKEWTIKKIHQVNNDMKPSDYTSFFVAEEYHRHKEVMAKYQSETNKK